MADQNGDPQTGKAVARSGMKRVWLVRLGMMFVVLAVGLVVLDFVIRPFVSPDIVGPSAIKYDSYYGKVLKPGYSGPLTSNGYPFQLDINSLGFRGAEPSVFPSGCVAFLGDSLTFGDTVNNDVVYPEVIRRRLVDRLGDAAPPVVNTAIPGNGQGRWLLFLRRDAESYEPRIIVMQFCRNDFHNNHLEKFYKLDDEGSLVELRVPPQTRFRAWQERVESVPVLPYSRIYGVLKQSVRVGLTNERPQDEMVDDSMPHRDETGTGPFDDLTYRLTEQCLEICREHGWPVIGMSAQILEGERRQRLAELFERYGHPFVAIPPISVRPELYNPVRDSHWNPDGHRYVADALFDHIVGGIALDVNSDDGSAPEQQFD